MYRRQLMGTAEGFTAVAEQMSDHYGTKISRQQVYQWWKRKTHNKAGVKFPVGTPIPEAATNRPSRRFVMRDVITWADAGVPVSPHAYATGDGWRSLGSGL
jgi:hypothetical protein